MNILAIGLCAISTIIIVVLMKIAANTQKTDWYNKLNKSVRIDISNEIKAFWKVSIRNIAINIAAIILLVAFLKDNANFIINGVTYFSLGYSVVSAIIIIYAFMKFKKNISA